MVKIGYMGDEVRVRQVQGGRRLLCRSRPRRSISGLGDRQKIDRVEIIWPGSSPSPTRWTIPRSTRHFTSITQTK